MAHASTIEKEMRAELEAVNRSTSDMDAARDVGVRLAAKAKAIQLSEVYFTPKHRQKVVGKLAELIQAARENGLKIHQCDY